MPAFLRRLTRLTGRACILAQGWMASERSLDRSEAAWAEAADALHPLCPVGT